MIEGIVTATSLAVDSSIQLQEELQSLVGAKYDDPRFDPNNCWGFVRYCYSLIGVTLPRRIIAARRLRQPVPITGPYQLMDVVYFEEFFLDERHVGIVYDPLWIIQSSKTTNGVAKLRIGRVSSLINSIHRLKPVT